QMTQRARPPGEVQAMLDAARTRTQRFEEALRLMTLGQYRQAREALFKIAAEDPQNKKYRVQLYLAWGMEHKTEKRTEDAIRELERAVSLEPTCTDAMEELQKLHDQQKKGGILSKLFGR